MKILIIGGTRFFGKRFVQSMIDQEHVVTLLTRGVTQDPFGDRVKRLCADRSDESQLRRVLNSDYDVVVDNMLMTGDQAQSLIPLLKDRIGHFVMTSTLSVYDTHPIALTELDFEAATYTPPMGANDYQAGKRSAEHVLSQAPFGVSIMRIPLIVGPEDHTDRLLTHIRAVKEKRKLFFPNLNARFSYLHARDAARALEWLSTEKPCGVYNISAPDAWTLHELMLRISNILKEDYSFGDAQDSPSPFGIEDDYFMDVNKAQQSGFQVDPLDAWMPDLIDELANR